MVVLLAAVVIGGLVWLVRLYRGGTRTDRARTDGAGPGLLAWAARRKAGLSRADVPGADRRPRADEGIPQRQGRR